MDSGHSVSSVVPIIDGYSHSYAHSVSFDGSVDVNFRLSNLLQKKYPGKAFSEDVIEEIKTTRCRVRNIWEKLETRSAAQNNYEMTYDLPDGTQISVGQTEMTLPYEKCFSNYIRGAEESIFNTFFAKNHLVSSP